VKCKTLCPLLLMIHRQLTDLKEIHVATQIEIDTLTTLVASQSSQITDLATALAGIQTDIDTLIAGQVPGEPVDLTGLQAAVGDLVNTLGAQVTAAQAIDAENPQTPLS
jgi:hypothetical protein